MVDQPVVINSYIVDQLKNVGVNKSCDIGGLILEDCSSYTDKSAKD